MAVEFDSVYVVPVGTGAVSTALRILRSEN